MSLFDNLRRQDETDDIASENWSTRAYNFERRLSSQAYLTNSDWQGAMETVVVPKLLPVSVWYNAAYIIQVQDGDPA